MEEGNYTVTYVVTDADTNERLAGHVFDYEVKSSLDEGSLLPNTPATGVHTISGTAQVGNELTAETSGIADTDGLANAEFTHQWLRNDGVADTEIGGATAYTYVLVPADAGKTIKVRVSFTDDANNEESLTSAATAVVAATKPDAPQNVRVAPHDANSLDVSWEAPSSDGGSAVTGYKVQRKEATGSWDTPADVSEETVTGNARTITGLTEGVAYAVRVIATNDVGDGPASDEATGTPRETTPPELVTAVVDGTALTLTYKESLDENTVPAAEAFAVMVGGTATTVDAVSISGSAVTLTLAQGAAAGDTVTVSYTVPSDAAASRIKDLAGNAAPSFSGQEVTNNTAGTAEDEGPIWAATMTVGIRDGGTGYSFWADPHLGSLSDTEIEFDVSTHTVGFILLLDGRLQFSPGNTAFPAAFLLTVNDEEFASADATENPGDTSYSYSWSQGGLSWSDGESVNVTLVLAEEEGQELAENSPATGAPTISGTAQVGEDLTASTSGISDADGLDNVDFAYQWLAGGSDISGATGSSYVLTSAEQGQTVQVRVTFTDDANNEESLTSAATAAVAAAATVTPSPSRRARCSYGPSGLQPREPAASGALVLVRCRVHRMVQDPMEVGK